MPSTALPTNLNTTVIPTSRFTSISSRVKAFRHAVQQSLSEADTTMTAQGSPILGFMLSEYNLGVLVMGFLLDRIQHVVVVPPRRENPTHLQPNELDDPRGAAEASTSRLRRIWQHAISCILPINASASHTRFLLRLPSLIFIYRALILNLLLILQVTSWMPNSWIPGSILEWALKVKMTDICWATFISTCLTLATIAFNNGLDGSGSDGSALSFNLLNFAMELHVLSTARAHVVRPEDLPPRPDLVGLLAMLAPLSDLAIYNTMGIRKSWGRKRLFPSTVAFAIEYTKHRIASGLPPNHYLGRNYDVLSMTYTLFLCIIGTTWLLKASTAILLGGSVSRNLLPANLTVSSEDHAQVVLIKLLAASIQTTGMSGLANELPVLNAYDDEKAGKTGSEEAVAHIGLDGTVVIVPGGKGGLGREIKKIKPQAVESSDAILGGWGTRSRWRALRDLAYSIWGCWRWTFWRLWTKLAQGLMGNGLGVAPRPPRIPGSPTASAPNQTLGGQISRTSEESVEDDDEGEDEQDALYQRFLRGTSILSDGSSEGYNSEADGDDERSRSDTDDDELPVRHPSRQRSTTPRPHDYENNGGDPSSTLFDSTKDDPSILLAHMLHTSPQPLTRQRYQATSLALSPLRNTSPTKRKDGDVDESEKQTCIVCYSEPRVVVCWPCRCLAMCDDCRSSMATLPLNQHLCPTCRTPVEGYSRIFAP
ncbi:hypothetical protein FRB93_004350 [Tulasnella sp. JGI-2019a]|nr:hypothetical protein FRB93_004350 [Tulasnella sp. JGI-2019a]